MKKKCKTCKSDINSKATKCPYCNEFQNWQKFINKWNLLLVFLFTCISLLSAPPIKSFFEVKRAEIKVSILDGDSTHLIFMLANTGNRPAGIVQIKIEDKDGSSDYSLGNHLKNRLLKPDAAEVINAKNGFLIPSYIRREYRSFIRGGETYYLVVDYVQLDGNEEFLYYPFKAFKPNNNIELSKFMKSLELNHKSNISTNFAKLDY